MNIFQSQQQNPVTLLIQAKKEQGNVTEETNYFRGSSNLLIHPSIEQKKIL